MKMREAMPHRWPRALGRDLESERRAAPGTYIARSAFRQSPQPAPDAGRWTSLQEHAAFCITDDEHGDFTHAQCFALDGARVVLWIAGGVRSAAARERAARALGCAAPTECG